MAPPENLHWATLIERLSAAVPDELAVVQHDDRRTSSVLAERAGRFAAALRGAGLDHGARVAQYLHNSPAYVETWIGSRA